MPCGAEKGQVATSFTGVVGNVVAAGFKLTIASPFNFVGAVMRLIAGIQNLEMCAELQGYNVEQMRQQREQLQREVDQLQRQLQQQPAQPH
jgi:TolA-binding protein